MSKAKEKYYEKINGIIKAFGNCDGYVNDYVKELEEENKKLKELIKNLYLTLDTKER